MVEVTAMKISMHTVILTEIRKLRRYSILRAGLIVVVLSDLFAFAPVFANDGVRKNYTLVMNNILESNCTCFFPALILLTGGFLARREYTDDTLKNILAVPVPLRKLLSGKMIVLFFLTVFFGILSGLLGTFLCPLRLFPLFLSMPFMPVPRQALSMASSRRWNGRR